MGKRVCVFSVMLALFVWSSNALSGTTPPDGFTSIYESGFYGITNNSGESTTIGETQLSMEVFVDEDYAVFRILNEGSDTATISELYFDDDDPDGVNENDRDGQKLSTVISAGSPDVNDNVVFTWKDNGKTINPKELPGGENYNFVSELGFQFDANNPAPNEYGVDPGEMIDIKLQLNYAYITNSLASELNNETMRIGLHVINFDNGESESFLNGGGTPTGGVNPIPEPGTMALVGFGLVGLAYFGRKRVLS